MLELSFGVLALLYAAVLLFAFLSLALGLMVRKNLELAGRFLMLLVLVVYRANKDRTRGRALRSVASGRVQ